MISFILATAMLLENKTYTASDLTEETICTIEQGDNTYNLAPLGMFYVEEPETEGLFPIRRPTPAKPAPEAPSMGGDDYIFPILGRLFWGILRLPLVQWILGFFVVKFILESIYGPAWVFGFITDVVTQVSGLFQGLMSPFNGGDEFDENELGEGEEWEWVEEDE